MEVYTHEAILEDRENCLRKGALIRMDNGDTCTEQNFVTAPCVLRLK